MVIAVVLAAGRWLPVPWFGPRLSAIPEETSGLDPLRSEALALAEQVVRDFPNDPDALFARGLVLSRFGLYTQAVEAWNACLELQPHHALAHFCLGQQAFEKGDCGKTIELMQQSLREDSETPDALLFIAKAQMHEGRMEEAAETLGRYVQQSPRSTEGHFLLGQIQAHLNRAREAADSYRTALKIDPKCKNAYYGLSEVYKRQGQEDLARQYRTRFEAVAADHDSTSRSFRRGYDDQTNMREGAAAAHVMVGKVYAARSDPFKAENHFRRACELDPKNSEYRELLARLRQER